MRRQRIGLPLQLAVAALAVMALAPMSARADNLESFNFSGTLTYSPTSSNSVTGSFTLDTTNSTLTAFDFTTPVATFDTADSAGGVASYTPALSPSEDFVELYFNDIFGNNLWLVFQTTVGFFNGNSFYTQGVDVIGGSTISNLFCFAPQCAGDIGSTFTSGSAAPSVSPVPEPSPLVLLGSGLMLLLAISSLCRAPKAAAAFGAEGSGGTLNLLQHGLKHLLQTRGYCA
jgi:hypothetical protein